MSPNPPFEDGVQATVQPQAQESQPQQRAIVQQVVQQPAITINQTPTQLDMSSAQDVSYIVSQVDEAMAEATAHVYAGEARLQENNMLEAIREFELARQLVERDIDPGLQYIQQIPKVQGGASILSDHQIQSMHTQRQTILGRINSSYDFQALYQRQQQQDRVRMLREQSKTALQPIVLSSETSFSQQQSIKIPIEDYVVDEYVVIDELAMALPQSDVVNYIEKFQQRRSTFHSYLLRTNQYYPIVKSILSSNGVPEELAYVGLVASGYQPAIKDSASGKVGLWQLSSDVARRYGLQVNSQKDERKDVEASTAAFARYIRDLQYRFGSWDLAIMGYEMGEQELQRAINRAGSYDAQVVRNYVGKSSPEGAFLPKFIAATLIAKNPAGFGFVAAELSQISGSSATQLPVNTELNETPVTTILNQ